MLARSYAPPRGPRVRLRLPHRRDLPAITALLQAQGRAPEELGPARLVHFDPRQRLVICATALLGSGETVIGIGAVELSHPLGEPDLVVVDDQLTEGLDELLRQALLGRATAILRTRAA